MLTNKALTAVDHLHTVALRNGFTEEQYWEHVVPRLDSLVSMTMVRSANYQSISVEFEADVPALMALIGEHKPLDDHTLVEAINGLNERIQHEERTFEHTDDFLAGFRAARDRLARMRPTE